MKWKIRQEKERNSKGSRAAEDACKCINLRLKIDLFCLLFSGLILILDSCPEPRAGLVATSDATGKVRIAECHKVLVDA